MTELYITLGTGIYQNFPPVRPSSLNLQGVFLGGAKLGHLPSKRKGGRFALIHQKNVKNIHNKSHLLVCI